MSGTELAFVAEGKVRQTVQWRSDYVSEQTPSVKILPLIGLKIRYPIWTPHMFPSFTVLRHVWGVGEGSMSFSN